ncbi:hypothetical protein [Paenibacillus sp. ATY16]|uniref:hypothetical protein n=1 Tax=Paenibacillus sp. ATY16 TaxID=1759312 RepID=UPI0032C43746
MEQRVVVCVNDDKEIRDAIEIYLKKEGIAVLKGRDRLEAIPNSLMPSGTNTSSSFKMRCLRHFIRGEFRRSRTMGI